MKDYVIKNNRKLRRGVTTGACAAAAAKAAVFMLLAGETLSNVTVTAKTGDKLTIDVFEMEKSGGIYSCSVIKDAGDDPDVTNGIKITACVSVAERGIVIDGGEGIGTVTKHGLKIPVGHAAINPGPLKMIKTEVTEVCERFGYKEGLHILISAPEGIEIAKRTMNERLGITGGISILGTTGIVEPMSERALLDAIGEEINVYAAGNGKELLITPGSYGMDFANTLGFNMEEAIKCSNFIGETLDYARFAGIKSAVIIGHAGKLVKLAGGVMNTHSSVADCRMEIIAAHCALAEGSIETVRAVMGCITVSAAIEIIERAGIHEEVWRGIGEKICFHLRERTKGEMRLRCIVFTEEHGVLIDKNV